jgi:hypothetical protein
MDESASIAAAGLRQPIAVRSTTPRPDPAAGFVQDYPIEHPVHIDNPRRRFHAHFASSPSCLEAACCKCSITVKMLTTPSPAAA